MRRKLGLAEVHDDDAALAGDLLEWMSQGRADFTLSFRLLCQAALGTEQDSALAAQFAGYSDWAPRWRARLAWEPMAPGERSEAMRQVNPAFIPRNHLVEAALEQAVERDDLSAFDALRSVLARPYDDQPEQAAYAAPPPPGGGVYRTFCGT